MILISALIIQYLSHLMSEVCFRQMDILSKEDRVVLLKA